MLVPQPAWAALGALCISVGYVTPGARAVSEAFCEQASSVASDDALEWPVAALTCWLVSDMPFEPEAMMFAVGLLAPVEERVVDLLTSVSSGTCSWCLPLEEAFA